MYVECLLKLAFRKTYTGVKWIKLADNYIHLKVCVLWKNEIYLLVGKVSNYHYGAFPNYWLKLEYFQTYEGWNFNSGNYLFTTDTK